MPSQPSSSSLNMGGRFLHVLQILLLSILILSNCSPSSPWLCLCKNSTTTSASASTCRDDERDVLLKIKLTLSDPDDMLQSWQLANAIDCCNWKGVGCDATTAYIIKLEFLPHDDPDLVDPQPSFSASELSPHLLDLKYLNHLDLSGFRFNGSSNIPYTTKLVIGSMKQLRYLNLSGVNFEETLDPTHLLTNLSSLEVLDISSSFSYMNDSKWLSNLVALNYLDLSGLNLMETLDIMQVLGMLPSLTHLALSRCHLNNSHLSIFNSTFLEKLVYLDIGKNSFVGQLPVMLQNMTSIRFLDLSMSISRVSVLPMWFENFKDAVDLKLGGNSFKSIEGGGILGLLKGKCQLRSLSMENNILQGDMVSGNSTGFFCATNLESLDLSGNRLGGKLPDWLQNLQNLKYLSLGHNLLEGSILDPVFEVAISLIKLDLSNNRLGGVIPKSLGLLQNLQHLDLSHNQFNRLIPESIGQLWRLEYLDFSGNSLEGMITEAHFANLSRLTELYLSDNRLTVSVKLDWLPPFRLRILQMASCKFGTILPQWIQNQTDLVELDLSNASINGNMPQGWLDSPGKMEFLYLSYNQITGLIPSVGSVSSGLEVYLSHNQITGLSSNFSSSASYLDLSWNRITKLKSEWAFSGQVDMSHNEIAGFITVFASKGFTLDLSFNQISGFMPNFSARVDTINLSHNQITDPKPVLSSEVSFQVDLSNNLIVGPIEILSSYAGFVDLSNNHITALLQKLPSNVQFLNLSSNQITNVVQKYPSAVSSLDLSHNQISNLTAQFSSSSIDLSHNLISGVIDPSFFASSVSELDLSYNQITGLLPHFSSSLSKLRLSNNQIAGLIPNFSSISSIWELDLSHNQITALTPNFSSSWWTMSSLDLSYNLISSLTTPNFLSISAYSVDLSHNRITGSVSLFPSSVSVVDLSYNQITGLMSNVSSNLSSLDLSYNFITESELTPFFSPTMSDLRLSYNRISGIIPLDIAEKMPSLGFLFLNDNRIFGPIPTSLCDLANLVELDLSRNNLSGEIPDCWGNSPSLSLISMSSNNLSGRIPHTMGNITMLLSIHLNNNSIQEEIPESLRLPYYLEFMDLGENKLSGSLPSWIGSYFPFLRMLRLRQNNFTGKLPEDICSLQNLQILDIAVNGLEGEIPNCFDNMDVMTGIIEADGSRFYYYAPGANAGADPTDWGPEKMEEIMKGIELEYTTNLKLLVLIDLSSNHFMGSIPVKLTLLKGLHGLNLSHNLLSGNIPDKIGDMWNLESLDLSNNRLSGKIPFSISGLVWLSHLNLSNNGLSGRIPRSTQLDTLYEDNHSIYYDNPLLCGEPLPNSCPGDEVPSSHGTTPSGENEDGEDKREKTMFYGAAMLGFATGLWGFVGVLLLNKNWRVAYFKFVEEKMEDVYVVVKVKVAKSKRSRPRA